MISCGEPSGDLYAGALARELLRADPADGRSPGSAVTGSRPRRIARRQLQRPVGDRPARSRARRCRARTRPTGGWSRTRPRIAPDVFVAIDFPDFNFLLAPRDAEAAACRSSTTSARSSGRGGAGRMKTMRGIADRVLVIFPFEEADLRAGRRAGAVGRPSAARRGGARRSRATLFLARLGLDPSRPVVALLPGSRRNEVRAILPDLARAAKLIRERDSGRAVRRRARAAPRTVACFEPLALMTAARRR